MFGLSYFFYPWGFIVQILAIVHFLRRRPENYWLYIIFLGWVPRRQCVHCRGSAAGHTATSRGDPWIRPKVPRSDTRTQDFG